MADDLSLTPLTIQPGMMMAQATPPAAPAGGAAGQDNISQLAAMFPDLDRDVLGSVLTMAENNLEAAIEQLLEMTGQGGGGGGGGGGGPMPGARTVMSQDEELARAMYLQFAVDLEQELNLKVPDEVRNDPELYQAFVASALADHESRMASGSAGGGGSSSGGGGGGGGGGGEASLAERIYNKNAATKNAGSGGMAAFLDRFRGKAKTTPLMSSTRVRVIAVDDDKKEGMKAGLLQNAGNV